MSDLTILLPDQFAPKDYLSASRPDPDTVVLVIVDGSATSMVFLSAASQARLGAFLLGGRPTT